MAPQDPDSLAGEGEERVRVPLELKGLGLLFNSSTFTHTFTVDIFLRHSVNKEAVVISIHRKQMGSLHVGAATDHRNKTELS